MQDNARLWQAVLGEIELTVSHGNFVTWFKNTQLLQADSAVAIIGVTNVFVKNQLERKYLDLLRGVLETNNIRPEVIQVKIHDSRAPSTRSKESDTVVLTNCGELISFEGDSTATGLYIDSSPRNSISVICPQSSSQFIKATFSKFDLETGDSLFAYDGQDTMALLVGNGSGIGAHKFNGGVVAANFDKIINPSGCLTFQFKTDGDNNKGIGLLIISKCINTLVFYCKFRFDKQQTHNVLKVAFKN